MEFNSYFAKANKSERKSSKCRDFELKRSVNVMNERGRYLIFLYKGNEKMYL